MGLTRKTGSENDVATGTPNGQGPQLKDRGSVHGPRLNLDTTIGIGRDHQFAFAIESEVIAVVRYQATGLESKMDLIRIRAQAEGTRRGAVCVLRRQIAFNKVLEIPAVSDLRVSHRLSGGILDA